MVIRHLDERSVNMPKLFREPLLHFIILGALLFIGHGLWAQHVAKSDYTIRVSPAEIQRQAQIFATENRREPNDEDIEALLFAHVEEQVLMREAERLGLGEDDTIIRRRLAQKMRFIVSDVGAPDVPKEAELKAWFEENKSDFLQAEQRSFRHIYFSPSSRDKVEDDARNALAQILLKNPPSNWETLGDPFMLSREVKAEDTVQITRNYGRDFAKAVFALEPNKWQGPVESALGLHLVYIDEVTPQSTPTFDQARLDIENTWQEQAARNANQKRLEDLLKKYKVVVEE